MADIWFISDTHFQHASILTFKDAKGNLTRTFSSVQEMDEYMVDRWNSVVKPTDKIYHLGDVFMGNKETFVPLWKRLNGHKRLLLGNHDDAMFFASKNLVDKIDVWRAFPDFGFIATHIPIHTNSMYFHRIKKEAVNVHGHTHTNKVMLGDSPDPRYRCVSVEQINYTPVNIEELRVY